MPRTRLMNDEKYIEYLEEYVEEKCNGNPTLVKKEQLARYISRKEGKNIGGHLLRRNIAVKNRLDELIKMYIQNPVNVITSINLKNLSDIKNNCPDYESLLPELIELHNMCKQLINIAKTSFSETKRLEKQNMTLNDDLKTVKEDLSYKTDENKELKRNILLLKKENRNLKDYIKNYINPEIASIILDEIGVSTEPEKVDKEKVSKNLLDADTEIVFSKTQDEDVNSIIELFGGQK